MKLKKILLSIFNNLPMVLAGVALFTIIVARNKGGVNS